MPAILAGPILEHGIGGAQDLPIPPQLAIAGAVAALTVSFAVLALAWRHPRYDAATSGRPAPDWLARIVDSTALAVLARLLGLALTGWLVWAATAGQDLLINPFFSMLFVHLWVGLVPASLVLGRVLRAMSPWRTVQWLLAKATRSDPAHGPLTLPARWGLWPAAVGLFAFVWLELVYPHAGDLAPTRLWFAVYAGAMLVGGALFGDSFYERCDPFEVYSSLVAKLSMWGRRDGVLVLRSPLANLDTQPPLPGLLAVTAVLFGSTAFDSFRESTTWLSRTQSLGHPMLVNLAGLLGFCLVVGGVFAAAAMATRVRPDVSRRDLPALFAHSIVPIIVGYIAAHYLTFLVEQGQEGLILMSDPLSNGSDLLGTGDWTVNYWLSGHPSFLAVTKVLAVVAGHVTGVVAAHDRAMKLLPTRDQVVGQLPLLFAMVGFTVGGLYLLFAA